MALPRPLLKTTPTTRQTSSEKSFAVVALSIAPSRLGGLTTGPALLVSSPALTAIDSTLGSPLLEAARTVSGCPARSKVSGIVFIGSPVPATAGTGPIGSPVSGLRSLSWSRRQEVNLPPPSRERENKRTLPVRPPSGGVSGCPTTPSS